MIARCALILLSASWAIGADPWEGFTKVMECVDVPEKTFRIVVESKMNQTGAWETTFNAEQAHTNTSDATKLDLKHSVVECDGKQILRISGVFRDSAKGSLFPALRFHERCGTNIAITNKGRTVQKLNTEDRINAVAITNRPLRSNELFEVRVDRKVIKDGFFMGIGMTSLRPDKDPIPPHLNSLKVGTWMFYHSHTFHNGTMVVKTYARNLDVTQAGDRVGVMRSDMGTLHLFYNGVDQGPAASNLPADLYGGLELYGDFSQITIVS
ncbi:neuralized-like protein 4 [Hetaerina americana]|uniref:neuralized-like protein 4 n=1 Tax=Hetaerina americana TaxID=62018 RepID=UPI003A7F4079